VVSSKDEILDMNFRMSAPRQAAHLHQAGSIPARFYVDENELNENSFERVEPVKVKRVGLVSKGSGLPSTNL